MCFYINNRCPNKRIAKEDVKCYKVLSVYYESIVRRFMYQPNYLYTLKNKTLQITYLSPITPSKIIEEGYHSYSSKDWAEAVRMKERPYEKLYMVVECTIPKGSEYYYNPKMHEYVSNQIIINE